MKCLILFVLFATFFTTLSALMHKISSIKSVRFLNRVNAVKMSAQTDQKRISVLVPVANGSEEIETVTIVDTLIRGGACVTLAAISSPTLQVRCSRGVELVADRFISDCLTEEWDMIVCPGGDVGAQHMSACHGLNELLSKQDAAGKYLGAICAAPAKVLAAGGHGKGHPMTCYPSSKYIEQLGARHVGDNKVVVSRHIITSQGPGTALEFSLKLVELLFGEEKAAQVRHGMVA